MCVGAGRAQRGGPCPYPAMGEGRGWAVNPRGRGARREAREEEGGAQPAAEEEKSRRAPPPLPLPAARPPRPSRGRPLQYLPLREYLGADMGRPPMRAWRVAASPRAPCAGTQEEGGGGGLRPSARGPRARAALLCARRTASRPPCSRRPACSRPGHAPDARTVGVGWPVRVPRRGVRAVSGSDRRPPRRLLSVGPARRSVGPLPSAGAIGPRSGPSPPLGGWTVAGAPAPGAWSGRGT